MEYVKVVIHDKINFARHGKLRRWIRVYCFASIAITFIV